MARYRAMYATQSCTADEEGNGRTLTVQLDKDPGFGSMIFTRVGRSQVELIEELPPLPAGPVREDVTIPHVPGLAELIAARDAHAAKVYRDLFGQDEVA